MHRSFHPFLGLTLLVAALTTSACLVPPSSSSVVEVQENNAPDPAWNLLSYGDAQVYTTGSGLLDIPTYNRSFPLAAGAPSETDALPTLPTYDGGLYYVDFGTTWAPDVRTYVLNPQQSIYFMVLTEQIHNQGDACIGAATSTDGVHFIPLDTWTFCSGSRNNAFVDPELFMDPNGNTWLLYSHQWAPNGGSEIDAVELDALGVIDGRDVCGYPNQDCGILNCSGTNCVQSGGTWSPYQLVTYSAVSSMTSDPGNCSYVEGPSMTADEYNDYDLTFSLGTWGPINGIGCSGNNQTYLTGEVPCGNPNGACVPSDGQAILDGDGGASMLTDAIPDNNWMIYHTWDSSQTNRVDFAGETSAQNRDPADLQAVESALPPITLGSDHPVYTPYHWWPRDIDHRAKDVLLGGTGPDPGATPTPGCPLASATPIDSSQIGPPATGSGEAFESETVGAITDAWSDPKTAGGCQGPTIPSEATLSVRCKTQGISLVDGNTWWYKIASAPWNDGFFAPADAFFNNGRTSGSLDSSLPFVDTSVPNC